MYVFELFIVSSPGKFLTKWTKCLFFSAKFYIGFSFILFGHNNAINSGLEISTGPPVMASALCCRTSRNFDCFQCELLNLPIHMVM